MSGEAGQAATMCTPQDRHKLLGLAVLAALMWAALCNLVLDASTAVGLGAGWRSGLTTAGMIVALAIIWLVILLVLAIIGRLWITFAVTLTATLVLADINMTKIQLRHEPLYPSDVVFLRTPHFLLEMVPTRSLIEGGILCAGVITLLILIGRALARRSFPPVTRGASVRFRRSLVSLRAVATVALVISLGSMHDFNHPGNPWEAAFRAVGVDWANWSQETNYAANGFVAGLLRNMPVDGMPEPPGYTKKHVLEVAGRYADEARARNLHRGARALADVNVVVVLSESLSDPTRVDGVRTSEDPMPAIRAVMQHSLSGQMLSSGFGSGTANIEFEALTGMSMSLLAPQLTTPYQQMIPRFHHFPSAVDWFTAHRHRAIAIHPFIGEFYRRSEVYPRLGFARFLHDTDMRFRTRHGNFISDDAAFHEVTHRIGDSRQPLFINLVTMQNHLPYGHQYDNPVPVSGLPEPQASNAAQYLRGVEYTDQAVVSFLNALKASPEKTAVVFYGDHLAPSIYPDSVAERNGVRRMHETPFFIWTNYRSTAHEAVPTTSPIHFLPMLFDAVDAPLPPYYALLDDLRAEVPAMDAGMLIGSDNQELKAADLSRRGRHLLADMRLIQYDLSIGQRWSENVMWGDAG